MPTITLTQTACTVSLSADWLNLGYSDRVNFENAVEAALGGAGTEITEIRITGRARNSATILKRLRLGFKPGLSSGRNTWATLDGNNVLDNAFTAIGGASTSGTYIYKTFTRIYNPTTNASAFALFAGHIKAAFAAGDPVYLGIIQPDSGKSISVGIEGYWKIVITYDLVGNIPTPSVNTAILGATEITTTINRVVSGSTTTLRYKIGDTVLNEVTGIAGTSDVYTPPTSAGQYFPTATSTEMTIEAETFVDDTSYGVVAAGVTLALPSDAAPTCVCTPTRTWVDGVPTAGQVDAYVQSKSGVSFALVGTGNYGATIAGYVLTIEGKTYTGDLVAHSPIMGSGAVNFAITVTDSRGLLRNYTGSLDVLPWQAPKIQEFTITRVTSANVEAIDGTYARAKVRASVSPIGVSGVEQNALQFCVQYREAVAEGETPNAWVSADVVSAPAGSTVITHSGLLMSGGSPIGGGGTDGGGNNLPFNDMEGYDFRVLVSDLYATSTAYDNMPTKEQIMDIDQHTKKIGFGGDVPSESESVAYRFYGLVEFMAGALGIGMVYSTDEIDTGHVWIDGKKIYLRVYTFTGTTGNGQTKTISLGNPSSYYGAFISLRGRGVSSNGYVRPLPCVDSSSYYIVCDITDFTGTNVPNVRIMCAGSQNIAGGGFVVVGYTKAD